MKKIVVFILIVLVAVAGFFVWRSLKGKASAKAALMATQKQLVVGQMLKLRDDLKKQGLYFIWIAEEKTKTIRPVLIRIGVTDDEYTEIKEVIYGELKEGQSVITGISTTKKETQQFSGRIPGLTGLIR